MSIINGAGTSFKIGDEDRVSTEDDDPDEHPDELNETFLSSYSEAHINNGASEREAHVYGNHGSQVGPRVSLLGLR
jgi:hypothetical protein